METTVLEVDFKYPVRLNACSAMASKQVSVYRGESDGLFGYIGTNTGEVGGFLSCLLYTSPSPRDS